MSHVLPKTAIIKMVSFYSARIKFWDGQFAIETGTHSLETWLLTMVHMGLLVIWDIIAFAMEAPKSKLKNVFMYFAHVFLG